MGVAEAQSPPTSTSPPSAVAAPSQARLHGADAQKLLGRDITNAQNEKIGEIKSIQLDQDGVVSAVIVSVGAFLALVDREVALAWRDITVTDNGEKVSTALTKEQLQNLPPYRYTDLKQRGTAFRDGPQDTKPSALPPSTPQATTTPLPRAGFTTGDVSGVRYARASVRNPAGESIGTVDEIVLSPDGVVKSVIVSVGGFLGVGSKRVAMAWKDFKIWQDKDTLTLVTEATKDELKAAPDYKVDTR
jgi:sporulation protein YlmC with PRC-barrel domain